MENSVKLRNKSPWFSIISGTSDILVCDKVVEYMGTVTSFYSWQKIIHPARRNIIKFNEAHELQLDSETL
jgi:hypothetical protein